MTRQLLNVFLLSLGFMFTLTSFFTVSNIEKTVLKSIEKDYPSFTGDGYTSQSIVYSVFAVCNWIAPSIINAIGSRKSMYLSSIMYIVFLASFLWPSNFVLYTTSVMIGFGASIFWTGQFTYISLNSDPSTISRNTGIFMATSKISFFIGNAFIIVLLGDKSELDEPSRRFVFVTLAVVSGLGTLLLMSLRPAVNADGVESERKQRIAVQQQLKDTVRLLLTKDMLRLCGLFAFVGLHVSFYSGVYSSCIAFTKSIGENTQRLLPYTGILIGLGEITGGLLCSILGKRSVAWSGTAFKGFNRSEVIVISLLVNILAYGMIFINLPNDSPFGDTLAKSFIEPNRYLAVFCGFLLGLSDTGFTTQVYNFIGVRYPENIASATSLFLFVQAISTGVSFFYSNLFGIYVQLIILMAVMMLGTVLFLQVDT